jgi:hypothetical protein
MWTADNGGTKAQTPGGLVYNGGGVAQRHDFSRPVQKRHPFSAFPLAMGLVHRWREDIFITRQGTNYMLVANEY